MKLQRTAGFGFQASKVAKGVGGSGGFPRSVCEGEKSHADAQDGELGADTVVKAGHA